MKCYDCDGVGTLPNNEVMELICDPVDVLGEDSVIMWNSGVVLCYMCDGYGNDGLS